MDIYFAAIGDVHGRVMKMLKIVEQWEKENELKISFILQVGDFEPHRSVDDLRTVYAPSKYKKIGDFPSFHSNHKQNKYQGKRILKL
ncbi:hypothetical protein [Lusitaniella coriacea]|uniref:hypothetical protein n=1 Tax=Lusitaniella coriacea TaxID=1983105 RepID=UPI003CEE309E